MFRQRSHAALAFWTLLATKPAVPLLLRCRLVWAKEARSSGLAAGPEAPLASCLPSVAVAVRL
jgi:hypothetical protein